MAERTVVVDKLRLTYEGLFDFKDLYATVGDWFEEKYYDFRELKNVERVTPQGKYIEIIEEPYKKMTEYAKSVIKVKMICNNVKEVEVEKDGVKVKINHGKVQFVFDAWLETDYEDRWEMKPTFFLIRTLFDKYFYKPFTDHIMNNVASDVSELNKRIKTFLNLYRY